MKPRKIIIITFFSIFTIIVLLVWYLYYPRKIVEKDQKSIKFVKIYNPFNDNRDYYQVIKYLYSKKVWLIGFGGSSTSYNRYYGYGLADAEKHILISPEYYSDFRFVNILGYTKNGIYDTINLIQVNSIKKDKQVPTLIKPNGGFYEYKNSFKNDIVIFKEAGNSTSGSLYNIKEREYIGNQQNMWWIDSNTILVKSYVFKKNSRKYTNFYGALSIKGDTIVHINKSSKQEVLDLITNANDGINSLIR